MSRSASRRADSRDAAPRTPPTTKRCQRRACQITGGTTLSGAPYETGGGSNEGVEKINGAQPVTTGKEGRVQ